MRYHGDQLRECDYLLLTALKDEADALESALCRATAANPVRRRPSQDAPTVFEWHLDASHGSLRIATSSLLHLGQDSAREWTRALLGVLEPRYVGFIGIAGAASENTPPGSILLAERIWYYEPARAGEHVQYRGAVHVSGRLLLDRLSTIAVARVAERFPEFDVGPKLIVGTLASGEKVIADCGLRDALRGAQPNVVGFEMEGHAFADEVTRVLGQERWFMVRAVQDHADESKRDTYRKRACERAAQFTAAFLLDCDLCPEESALEYARPRGEGEVVPPSGWSRAGFEAGALEAEWVRCLAGRLDSRKQHSSGYLDRSARAVRSLLERLDALLELDQLLNDEERYVLMACGHLSMLGELGASLAEERSALCKRFPEFSKLDDAVGLTMDTVGRGATSAEPQAATRDVRYGLLAALLQLGQELRLERSAVVETRPLLPPAEAAGLEEWMAYLTSELHVPRRGLVAFRVLARESQSELIRTYVGLRFEYTWQTLREVLTYHGVCISRQRTHLAVLPEIGEVPAAVASRLADEVSRLRRAIVRLEYLGEEEPVTRDIGPLLPLPQSAIAGPVEVPIGGRHDYVLILQSTDFSRPESEALLELRADRKRRLVIDPEALEPGREYAWRLLRDDGDFRSETVRGVIRTLTREHLAAWQLVYDKGEEARVGAAARLGLWTDVLAILWPRLRREVITLEDLMTVHHLLVCAYDWVRRHAPYSGLVDLYRDAANSVRSLLQPRQEV